MQVRSSELVALIVAGCGKPLWTFYALLGQTEHCDCFLIEMAIAWRSTNWAKQSCSALFVWIWVPCVCCDTGLLGSCLRHCSFHFRKRAGMLQAAWIYKRPSQVLHNCIPWGRKLWHMQQYNRTYLAHRVHPVPATDYSDDSRGCKLGTSRSNYILNYIIRTDLRAVNVKNPTGCLEVHHTPGKNKNVLKQGFAQ